MNRKKFNFLSFAALAALILGGVSGLVSCDGGGTPTPDPDPTPSDPVDENFKEVSLPVWQGSEDPAESKVQLSLASELVVSADDPTYFSPYIVRVVNGEVSFISSGGDALLESGETASLMAYGVPSGFTLFASARNASTGASMSGVVAADGSILAPAVSVKTDIVITLSARNDAYTFKSGSQTATGTKFLKKTINLTVVPSGTIARNKSVNYRVLSEQDRNKITGKMEEYALHHGLTGVHFTSNGGQALYSTRVSSPLLNNDSYLASYGFGTSQYGTITAPMDATHEPNTDWAYYNHSLLSPASELGTINYIDSDQAAVSNLYGYISSSFWGVTLNEDYTGTELSNVLARGAPEPVNADEDGIATKWKVKVWVGGDVDDEARGVKAGLNYRTGSSVNSSFDNRPIALEDYITPVKLMATGAIGWYRGEEAAESKQAKTRLVGFSDYFNATSDAEVTTEVDSNATFLSKVSGLTMDASDNSITYEFEDGFDINFARYYLGQLWTNPICEDFVRTIGNGNVIDGAKIYGTSSSTGLTPADTILSVGPYYLEKYTTQTEVVFKRNDSWPLNKDHYDRTLYQVEGYHMRVDSALANDSEEAMRMFEGGYTDSVTLNSDAQFEKYGNDPRLKTILPDGYFGTTFNRMDKALWDSYFGEGGLWYYASGNSELEGALTEGVEVNPFLQNDNYYKALDLGIDRAEYAEAERDFVVYEYFQPGQQVDPTTDAFYNDTDEHKAAIEAVYGDAFDDPSDTADAAAEYMLDALIEELDAGHLELGTGEVPTDFGFTTEVLQSEHYERIGTYQNEFYGRVLSRAINSYRDEDGNNPLLDGEKPRVTFTVTQNSHAYSGAGQNELLFSIWSGAAQSQSVFSISGNDQDSIDYLDILTCNQAAGFELAFAVDTNVPSGVLEYDGMYWSFESLWHATAGTGAIIDADGRGSAA